MATGLKGEDLEPVCPLFWGLNPPKQGPNFNQNKGHLGSRYTFLQDKDIVKSWNNPLQPSLSLHREKTSSDRGSPQTCQELRISKNWWAHKKNHQTNALPETNSKFAPENSQNSQKEMNHLPTDHHQLLLFGRVIEKNKKQLLGRFN